MVMELCRGSNVGMMPPSVLASCSRLLEEEGNLIEAHNELSLAVVFYRHHLDKTGLASMDPRFVALFPLLRRRWS